MTVPIHRHASLPSTQDLLHRMAEDGAPDGAVVIAEVQEGGRGQRGRSWESPKGGLWMSLLVRPKGTAAGEVLSLRAGLAVARALGSFPGLPAVSLKWPNDLFLGDKKVGGLLCEARWRGTELWWVVIGLGINVTNPIPLGLADTATRLYDFDPSLTPDLILPRIIEELTTLGGGASTLSAEERTAFGERHWLKGKRVSGPVPGRVGGVAADGALLVALDEGGTMPVRSASVVLE